MKIDKLRLSYSKLNSFANYDKQEAIDMILGKQITPTPAMKLGTLAHKIVEDEKLDLEGIGEGGVYEMKKVVPLYNWLDFAFVCDRVKDGVLVDYKTGKGDPMQLYVYAFLLAMEDIPIHEGRLVYVNCNEKTREVTKRSQRKYSITPAELNKAWCWIDETSHEIRDFLSKLNTGWDDDH